MAVAATALLVVLFPLGVYTTTLAVFGLAHVLSELRFVDERYGGAIGARLRVALGVILAGVAGSRGLVALGVLDGYSAVVVELVLLIALAVAVMPMLERTGVPLVVAGLVATGVWTGLQLSPIHTLLVLAVLHNFTPLAFLAEALPPHQRGSGLGVAVLCFIAVPLFIATGLPREWLTAAELVRPNASLFDAGGLASQLRVYVPSEWHDRPWAIDAFSAAVFAQCMHYAAVIHVLPGLTGPGEGTLPWPDRRTFVAAMGAAGLVLLGLFALDFGEGRAIYAIFAAVHAWVEVPILLLALGGTYRS